MPGPLRKDALAGFSTLRPTSFTDFESIGVVADDTVEELVVAPVAMDGEKEVENQDDAKEMLEDVDSKGIGALVTASSVGDPVLTGDHDR